MLIALQVNIKPQLPTNNSDHFIAMVFHSVATRWVAISSLHHGAKVRGCVAVQTQQEILDHTLSCTPPQWLGWEQS